MDNQIKAETSDDRKRGINDLRREMNTMINSVVTSGTNISQQNLVTRTGMLFSYIQDILQKFISVFINFMEDTIGTNIKTENNFYKITAQFDTINGNFNNYNNKFNTLADQIVKMESLYNQIITERQALDKRHKENSSSMYAGSTKTRRRRRRK